MSVLGEIIQSVWTTLFWKSDRDRVGLDRALIERIRAGRSSPADRERARRRGFGYVVDEWEAQQPPATTDD